THSIWFVDHEKTQRWGLSVKHLIPAKVYALCDLGALELNLVSPVNSSFRLSTEIQPPSKYNRLTSGEYRITLVIAGHNFEPKTERILIKFPTDQNVLPLRLSILPSRFSLHKTVPRVQMKWLTNFLS
ncbi:hypothetical protein KKC97_13520, partial [bacterium]|nr:hypothetical protein [bacterium]